jgi:ribose 5-phosphate isomerase B
LDLGAPSLEPGDDFTKYAQEVASLVASNEESRGILLCGSGVGVEVMANKFDGIRAAIGKSVLQVEAGRNDDDMNILVIAADYTTEKETKAMLIAFLETKFSGKAKYEKRLEEIEKIEANN